MHANANLTPCEQTLYALLVRTLRQQVKGKCEVAAKIRRQAIRTATRFLADKPSSRLWTMLGDIYVQADKSEACYRQAMRLDRQNAEAVYEIARIEYYEKRHLKAAVALMDRIVKRPPPDIACLVLAFAAEVYAACGRTKDAASARRRSAYWARDVRGKTIAQLDPDWNTPDAVEACRTRKTRTRKPRQRGRSQHCRTGLA